MAIGFHLDDIEEAYFKNNMADDKPIGGLSNCDMPLPQGFGKQEGWICPVCGRGVAPWVDVCPCRQDAGVINVTTTAELVDLSKYYTLINDGMVPEAKL
jgi:hypothetical protein